MKRSPGQNAPPDACPNCGAEVPHKAKACPECGADEDTGWSVEAQSDSLGLPDDSFDYDEYVERELGDAKARPRGIGPLWWVTAVVLLVAWVVWTFMR